MEAMTYKKAGFTLMEVMVSVFISGIILTSVVSSYAALLQNKQKIDQFRYTQATATLIISRIADKVRDYGIDYESYTGADATGETQSLFVGPFIDSNGEEHRAAFQFLDGEMTMSLDDLTAPLNGQNVVVSGEFSVLPTTVPTEGQGPVLYQPRVEINLSVQSKIDPDVVLDLQTTISSRRYR